MDESGAASALRESIGAPLSPAEISQQRQLLDSACGAMSPEARAALWAQGRAMALEQAIDHAVCRE